MVPALSTGAVAGRRTVMSSRIPCVIQPMKRHFIDDRPVDGRPLDGGLLDD